MESDHLRKFYGMSEADTGVLVAEVFPLAPARDMLKKGDVILSMDGIRVSGTHINNDTWDI
jgi:S1-C subfamily serine protease